MHKCNSTQGKKSRDKSKHATYFAHLKFSQIGKNERKNQDQLRIDKTEYTPSSRDIAVSVVRLEGQVLGVSFNDLAVLKRGFLLDLGELVRGLVEDGDILGVHGLDNAEGGEACATTDIDNHQIRVVQIRRLKGVLAHVLGPMPGVDHVVVHNRQKPVEPEGLLLVLDEAGLVRGAGHALVAAGAGPRAHRRSLCARPLHVGAVPQRDAPVQRRRGA